MKKRNFIFWLLLTALVMGRPSTWRHEAACANLAAEVIGINPDATIYDLSSAYIIFLHLVNVLNI